MSTLDPLQNLPDSRSPSQFDLRSMNNALEVAAREPGPEEISYFVNPLTGKVEETARLADFKEGPSKARGSSGVKVYEATYNNSRFAIKEMNGLLMDSGQPAAVAFKREMTFLRKTTDWKCSNIVQFHGFIRTGGTARLILELMDKDLSEVINSLQSLGIYNKMNKEGRDLEDIGYIMLRDISNGLRFMHGHNPKKETFLHMDIQSSNIMILVKPAEYRFALIDFGTTKKKTGEGNNIHTRSWAGYYEAPECFEQKYCESCDIWSMGITIIQFIAGKHPIWDEASEESFSSDEYNNNILKDNEIYRRITGKGCDWPIGLTSEFLSQDFKNAINACVNRDPKKRPTARTLYEIAKKRADSIDPFRVPGFLKVAVHTKELSSFVNPLTDQAEQVRPYDFEEGSLKRRSSSGHKVYEATYKGSRFAIKEIDEIPMDSSSRYDRPAVAFEREMEFLRSTTDWNCRNIVQFHGFIRTGRSARLILELMDKDLSDVINSLNSSDFYNQMNQEGIRDLEDIGYIILKDTSNGLRFTHGHNPKKEKFMHRDIKSSNIMVKCAECRFAIIDFDSTKNITGVQHNIHSEGAGQAYYVAPECLEDEPKYCESCDIWSMGITMIKFVTGKHPIWDDASEESSSSNENIKTNKIRSRITGKGYNGEKYDWPIGLTSDFLSQDFRTVINDCVNRDPKKRPTAQELYDIAKERADSINPPRVQELFGKFCGS